MTTDVAQQVITANAVKNGTAIVGVNMSGDNHTLDARYARGPVGTSDPLAGWEALLTLRFDNVTYYTT